MLCGVLPSPCTQDAERRWASTLQDGRTGQEAIDLVGGCVARTRHVVCLDNDANVAELLGPGAAACRVRRAAVESPLESRAEISSTELRGRRPRHYTTNDGSRGEG